ncbi:hypothetical protein ES703_42464 [subsurface metagenome]
MSKQDNARLVMPPRYFRNDPRNKVREAAGQALGRQLQGYDLPVRRLRNRNGSKVLTIPPEVCEALGVDNGDDILFSKTLRTGMVIIAGMKKPDNSAGCRRDG